VSTIHDQQENTNPKHYKNESSKPRHYRKVSKKPKILKTIILAELLSVILACCYVYVIWCHNLEMRYFGEVCPVVLTSANDCMDKGISVSLTHIKKRSDYG
jgi:hypothetical protein